MQLREMQQNAGNLQWITFSMLPMSHTPEFPEEPGQIVNNYAQRLHFVTYATIFDSNQRT
jgi:hypothetical protein